ncbi:TPA: hypothetical protein ACN30M_001319 [Vibrio parahaemolyticus]|uniref:hypothetical protein n=1 Tax=Vibrio parahaemolyticus TaxID=670 RepID=UPI00248CC9F1|nr:hypothetical protein [Vibrio parahaemolyticus]
MVLTSKVKVVISVIAMAISSIFLALNLFGVIPFLVLVLSFFTFIIQGTLCFLGYKDGDMFEAYQDSERTEATAFTNLFKDKKDCKKL